MRFAVKLFMLVSLTCSLRSAYGNIMYDRRIVRGNTYALHTLPAVRNANLSINYV